MLTELEQHLDELEELAAYVDDRLSGERKARVEERLLHDEAHYEIFLGMVRSSPEVDEGSVVETAAVRWRPWAIVGSSLAAAAVLTLTLGLPRLSYPPRGEIPSASGWVAHLDPATVVRVTSWTEPGWSRLRQGDASIQYQPEELAFRLGVRAVDLHLAFAAGHWEDMVALAGQLERLASAADLYPLAATYENLGKRLANGELDVTWIESAEKRLTGTFEDRLPEARALALGQWAEAGRLASLARDASALADIVSAEPSSARSIDRIGPQAKALETCLERFESGEDCFDRAAVAFHEILRLMGG